MAFLLKPIEQMLCRVVDYAAIRFAAERDFPYEEVIDADTRADWRAEDTAKLPLWQKIYRERLKNPRI